MAKKTPAQNALAFARKTAKGSNKWSDFSNALFGIGGKFGELFPTRSDRTQFAKTEEYREIMQIMEELQGKSDDTGFIKALGSANGTIITRTPKSLHAALIAEAESEGVSLNQLCVAKLSSQLRALV